MRISLCLLAVAGVLALAPVFAKDPAEAEGRVTRKGTAARVAAEPVAIPDCLAKLSLAPKQQDEIKAIIGHSDAAVAVVWQQFSERYMRMIVLESSMLAAIEDNLTDAQRQQVRDQRRKTAHHEKVVASTNGKPNQATSKPADVVADELAGVGVTLSTEQENAAEEIHEKYRAQLRSLHRDIHGLHTRLVSLEADKLVQIEKVLTKEQLSELRMHRASAPVIPKVAVGTTEAQSE